MHKVVTGFFLKATFRRIITLHPAQQNYFPIKPPTVITSITVEIMLIQDQHNEEVS